LAYKKKRHRLSGIDARQSGGVKNGEGGKGAMKSRPSAAARRTVASKTATITHHYAKADNFGFSSAPIWSHGTKTKQSASKCVGRR
jgi:hypothetical protein